MNETKSMKNLTLKYRNADSIIEEEDEELLFVKPYEIEEKFEDALHKIQEQERHPRGDTSASLPIPHPLSPILSCPPS